MRRFVEGTDRGQSTLFPEYLEDWIGEDNPVRAIDVFVEELDLAELGLGEDREAERGDAAPCCTQGADARHTGPADIADRS
jgi:hypothetical protein